MSFGVSVGDIIKICEVATRVYKNCRDCPGGYKSLTSEARNLTNILQDVADKVESNTVPESKTSQLFDVYESCVEVLQELDAILNHYNSLDTKTKRAFDRIRYDPEKTKSLRQKLTSNVAMLTAFYTSLIHDSQVHILEALGRLEKDYRGGHREESIASVKKIASREVEDDDEEGDDAAWPQIIRDLEDVGISTQDAIDYRDFIIDWFVRAVNEGRLMEEHAPLSPVSESMAESFSGLNRDTRDTLLVPTEREVRRMPSWETPHFPSKIRRKPVPNSSPRSSMSAQAEPSRPGNGSFELHSDPTGSSNIQTSSLTAENPPAASTSRPDSGRDMGSAIATTGTLASTLESLQLNPEAPRPSSARGMAGSVETNALSSSTTPAVQNVQSSPATFYPTPTTHQQALIDMPVQHTAFVHRIVEVPASALEPPMAPQSQVEPTSNVPAPLAAQTTSPPPAIPPPAYNQLETRLDDNLIWTAQRIVAAWNSRDFITAEKQLENQVAAVERGSTIMIHGQVCQPDRRLLRHLLGVCTSYSGNFQKAKRLFEGAFNGIYLSGPNIDDGDIAATRWLGDVCVHLNEPHNAALAWSVCLNGMISRYGVARDITRRVYEELKLLDDRIQGLQILAQSFSRYNTDASDIFRNTHTVEKSSLITSTIDRLKQISTMPGNNYNVYGTRLAEGSRVMSDPKTYRPRAEWKIAEGFLVQPLISSSAWPLPYDSSFSPCDAINLQRNMTAPMNSYIASGTGITYEDLPTVGLGNSKYLHYVTKRNIRWLVQAVETGLKEMGVEFREQGTMLICRLSQRRDSLVFYEGLSIKFRKLQFRNMWGLKISEVMLATRSTPSPTPAFATSEIQKSTEAFRDVVKAFLETAEQEERLKEIQASLGSTPQTLSPSLPHVKQRDTYSYG
ncbi:hypothetical protein BCR34DRAFT_341593 [Clohesyomyces aquaticus]|uniref:Fungal N-terminal domain-containing protein n=1 Tax=Clohesyomyces aquaticus TaxID=1231657 RepID=A0A1Y2A6X0_9PLEO|nr:hypothetical protein BCR34DRAFT_341593 [Clohesyomyces aquaticus]